MLSAAPAPAADPDAPAQAQGGAPAPPGAIAVIEVSGRLDRIVADFVSRSVRRAGADGDEVLVVQLDSPGSLLGRADLDALAGRIRRSRVPVAVWVGPSGARAYGGATRLLRAAAVAGMAPGTHVGKSTGEGPGDPLRAAGALGPGAAKARGAVSVVAPTLGEFVVGLDGRELAGRVVHTARVVTRGGQPRREAAGDVRFSKLGLLERVLHSAASPQVAYLLVVIGLLLVVFEFFTVGVGLAGVVGAGCLVLAAYGLAALPTREWALGLIGVGILGFAIDVQAGAPRSWTVIGTTALTVGSWRLFDDPVRIPWFTVVLVVGGVILLMVAGMASMLRARFSTPTIGRESMIGEMGEATTGVGPEGTVRVRGGLWRARTNRATPIVAGAAIRVVAIDGLLLEVEPETGGAREAGH